MTTRVAPQLIDQTNGIGYTTGSGGMVTQETSKSAAVTLNKACGVITMNSASLNAATTVIFTLNNTLLASGDLLIVNCASGVFGDQYNVWVMNVSSGAAIIAVRNISGGARSDALPITFAVIKSVVS